MRCFPQGLTESLAEAMAVAVVVVALVVVAAAALVVVVVALVAQVSCTLPC